MHDTSVRNPDRWPVGPAPVAASCVGGLTILGFAAAWLNGLALIVQIPIAVGTLALGGFAVDRLRRPTIKRIQVDGLRVRTEDASARRREGAVSGAPFVSPLFVGIRWRTPGRRLPRATGIFREQLHRDDFRRLCATLRQQGER